MTPGSRVLPHARVHPGPSRSEQREDVQMVRRFGFWICLEKQRAPPVVAHGFVAPDGDVAVQRPHLASGILAAAPAAATRRTRTCRCVQAGLARTKTNTSDARRIARFCEAHDV